MSTNEAQRGATTRFAFWTQTFHDKDFDFTGRVDGVRIGRISKIVNGPRADAWLWRMFAYNRPPTAETGLASGTMVGNRKDIERHVEAVYLRWRKIYG